MMRPILAAFASLLTSVVASPVVASADEVIKIDDPQYFNASPPSTLVVDTAGIFSTSFEDEINARLLKVEKQSGIQFVLMTIDDRIPQKPNLVASLLLKGWAEADKVPRSRGILLFSPTKRKFIFTLALNTEVTQLPDGFTINDYLDRFGKKVASVTTPHLKQDNYTIGMQAAISAIEQAISDPTSLREATGNQDKEAA